MLRGWSTPGGWTCIMAKVCYLEEGKEDSKCADVAAAIWEP